MSEWANQRITESANQQSFFSLMRPSPTHLLRHERVVDWGQPYSAARFLRGHQGLDVFSTHCGEYTALDGTAKSYELGERFHEATRRETSRLGSTLCG